MFDGWNLIDFKGKGKNYLILWEIFEVKIYVRLFCRIIGVDYRLVLWNKLMVKCVIFRFRNVVVLGCIVLLLGYYLIILWLEVMIGVIIFGLV